MSIDILGISELKWMGMGEFNSDDHYIYYCGQEFLRRIGVALTVNKKSKMQYLGAGALGRPRGMGWRGRWDGGSGRGTHINPWLIHVNV